MREARKALYVCATEPVAVGVDGPALRVRQRHSDDKRFPLDRVSRVVAAGAVDWALEALLACGAAGIVVCALRADGMVGRHWVGRPSTRSTFTEDWSHFLERPGGRHKYRRWALASRRRAMRLCAVRMGLGGRGVGRMMCMVRREVAGDAGFRVAKRRLYGLAQARCLEEVAKLGFCNADAGLAVVVPDLVTVVQWGLHPSLSRYWRRGGAGCETELVALFEDDRRAIEFHLRDALTALARLVGESA